LYSFEFVFLVVCTLRMNLLSPRFSCIKSPRTFHGTNMKPFVPRLSLNVSRCVLPLPQSLYITPRFYTTTSTRVEEPINDAQQVEKPNPRSEVLDRALKYVQNHGWSTEALAAASMEMGYPGIAHGMFTDGPVELVYHFVNKSNEEMINKLSEVDLQRLPMKERLYVILKTRLQLNEPFISQWPQALSLMGTATQLPKSLPGLVSLIDEILYQAGDQSTDFDWYTKRGLVSAIYFSSELYMLSDASRDRVDSWNYLQRRIDDLVTLTNFKTEFEKTTSVLTNGVLSLLSRSFGPK